MSQSRESSQITNSGSPLGQAQRSPSIIGGATDDGDPVTPSPPLDHSVGISPTLLDGSPSTRATSPAPTLPASGGLVYDAMGGRSAWWTPIQANAPGDTKTPERRRAKRGRTGVKSESEDNATSVEMVQMSNRSRLRKVDNKGQLVWPFELETVLIAGLRKYHATTYRPRPSACRNLNRNKLVSEYIETMTGVKRTTKQIASRIQVLRDAWKGKKEFSLVAQPRELAEMGYLPPMHGQILEAELNAESAEIIPEDTGPGPIRTARRTRRARKSTKQRRGVDSDSDSDFEVGAAKSVPPATTRMSRSSSISNSGTFSPVTLDPYQLDKLGPPQTSLENTIPSSTLFFIRNTLQGEQRLPTILAKCKLAPVSSKQHKDASFPEACMVVEIDAASIQDRIDRFEDGPSQRSKLGTHVHLLQSSVVWNQKEVVIGRDAGLVEEISAHQNQASTSSPNGYRYSLELQLAARRAIAAGERYVIVVQNLSLLRAADSRMLDSWMIIWLVERSSQQAPLELIHLSNKQKGSQRFMLMRPASPMESETGDSPVGSPKALASPPSPQAARSPAFEEQVSLLPVPSPNNFKTVEITDDPGFAYSPPFLSPAAIMDEDVASYAPIPEDEDHGEMNLDSHMVENFPESHVRGSISQMQHGDHSVSQQSSIRRPMVRLEYASDTVYRSHTPASEGSPTSPLRPPHAVIHHSTSLNHNSKQILHTIPPSRASTSLRGDTYSVPSLNPSLQVNHISPRLLSREWGQEEVDHGYEQPTSYHPVYLQTPHLGPQYMYVEGTPGSASPSTSAGSVSSLVHYPIDADGNPLAEHQWHSTPGAVNGVTLGPHRRLSQGVNWMAEPFSRRSSLSSGPAAPVPPSIQIPHAALRPARFLYPQESFAGEEAVAPDMYLPNDIPNYHQPHYLHNTDRMRSQIAGYNVPHSQAYSLQPREPSVYGVHQY